MICNLISRVRYAATGQIVRACNDATRIVAELLRNQAAVAQPGNADREIRPARNQIGQVIREIERDTQFWILLKQLRHKRRDIAKAKGDGNRNTQKTCRTSGFCPQQRFGFGFIFDHGARKRQEGFTFRCQRKRTCRSMQQPDTEHGFKSSETACGNHRLVTKPPGCFSQASRIHCREKYNNVIRIHYIDFRYTGRSFKITKTKIDKKLDSQAPIAIERLSLQGAFDSRPIRKFFTHRSAGKRLPLSSGPTTRGQQNGR